MDIKIKEIELTRLDLAPNDHLIVKVSGPEFGDQQTMESLSTALRNRFPNNKIMVFYIPEGNAMTFEAVKDSVSSQAANDCSIPTSFCNDCHCGKKERILGGKE